MMKKYLMTGLVAVSLSGLFTGCSQDVETGAQINTAEFNILENYENAFVARFGQPAENQNWGFGSSAATRGVNPSPSVTPSTKTYNAQMAIAWTGVEAAKTSGSDATLFDDMNTYAAWKNSGWTDQFFDVHGTVESSTISEEQIAAFTRVIVGTEEKPGLIPENVNNLAKAQSTGYSIVTTGGPVTLTPIYHYSNSGDRLSYYYYPSGSKPSAEQIKTMPKYSLGNMSDPQHYGDTHFYRNTYSLVYVDADGNCSYDFPANYVINFVISNTWNDYAGNKDKIYQEGGVTTNTQASGPTLTSLDKYAITEGQTIQCGDAVNAPNNKLRIQFSKAPEGTTTTTTAPQFAASQEGPYIWSRSTYTHYTAGNGVNGTLTGGSTCYYFKANETGILNVAVRKNGGTLKVCEIGNDWDGTGNTSVSFNQEGSSHDPNNTVCAFHVTQGKVYAVYEENGVLGFYGYTFLDNYGSQVLEDKPLDANRGPYDCGREFGPSEYFFKIYLKLGKEATAASEPEPIYFKTATAGDGNHPIEGYPAYTAGTNENGGYSAGSTTYFIRPTEAGVLRVAVRLNKNKKFHVEDLGEWGWYNTSGTTLISEIKDASNPYYGTYDINVSANHVYAIYAEGSNLGFFGCELFKVNPAVEGSSSTSNVVWKEIPRTPDYYSDGDLNTEIHNTSYGYGVGSAASTSHTAVFKSTVNNIDYTFIGFEDWIDFDYNDLVFAITGTTPETPQDPIVIPDNPDNPDTPDNPTDPATFICRVIAEDLTVGENSDFDFNDVVFDVFCDGSTTTIRLRAAGGELPLYIDGHEVHQEFATKYFDVTSTSLVNTGWRGSTLDYNNYYVDFTIGGVYNDRESVNSIPVVVTKKGKDKELVNILLTAHEGKVASKVCVGRDYEWCAERQDIDSKFHNGGVKLFHEYVIGTPGYRGDWKDGNAWYQLLGQ